MSLTAFQVLDFVLAEFGNMTILKKLLSVLQRSHLRVALQ